MINKITVLFLGLTFYSLTSVSADDSLCRELVKKSFDNAISKIASPKHIVDSQRLAVGSYIINNPLRFTKKGAIEVIDADADTPLIKVDKDSIDRNTEYKPIKLLSSSLIIDKESAKREFPFLETEEAEICKFQTLVLASEHVINFPTLNERSKQDSSLTIHALYCSDGIRAFKYSGKVKSEYYENNSPKPELRENISPTHGFLFETINEKCVLKSKSLSFPAVENVNRDECIQFYSLMNYSDKLTENVSRDESSKNVCYTKPAMVTRGKNLSTYIPNNVWQQMKGDNLDKLTRLVNSIQTKNIAKGNILFAESLNQTTITEQDIIRGCDLKQVSLASTVEALDRSCLDYRTFIPNLKNQPLPTYKEPAMPTKVVK